MGFPNNEISQKVTSDKKPGTESDNTYNYHILAVSEF